MLLTFVGPDLAVHEDLIALVYVDHMLKEGSYFKVVEVVAFLTSLDLFVVSFIEYHGHALAVEEHTAHFQLLIYLLLVDHLNPLVEALVANVNDALVGIKQQEPISVLAEGTLYDLVLIYLCIVILYQLYLFLGYEHVW